MNGRIDVAPISAPNAPEAPPPARYPYCRNPATMKNITTIATMGVFVVGFTFLSVLENGSMLSRASE